VVSCLLREAWLRDQTRLLRILSGVLKMSREGDCTASLGNLFHCFTVLLVEKLSLIPRAAPLLFWFMPFACHLPTGEPGAWLRLLSSLRGGKRRLCSRSHCCDYQGSCSNTESVLLTDREREWLEKRIRGSRLEFSQVVSRQAMEFRC